MLNCHKKGLRRLLDDAIDGNVGRLVLTHKDRLLRFGAELVFRHLRGEGGRGGQESYGGLAFVLLIVAAIALIL